MARNAIPITIANGATVSSIAQGNGLTPVGIYLPGAFTGTTLTFIASRPNGGQAGLVGDGAGASYTKTVRAGDYIPLSRDLFTGIDCLQVVSGSSEGAARILQVIFN
jgi:hypothetical protein